MQLRRILAQKQKMWGVPEWRHGRRMPISTPPVAFEKEPAGHALQPELCVAPETKPFTSVSTSREEGRVGDRVISESLSAGLGRPWEHYLEESLCCPSSFVFGNDRHRMRPWEGASIIQVQHDLHLSIRLPDQGNQEERGAFRQLWNKTDCNITGTVSVRQEEERE